MADPVHGLLLAAGEGRRMGMPNALLREDDGTSWLCRSIAVLRDGGCDPVTVVLGAGAAQARLLLDGQVEVVVAGDWAEGMGASLRAGLGSLGEAAACLVSLVDLPDVGADVVRRLVGAGAGPAVLARAAYAGVPGHPVLIGQDHWAGIVESAVGDRGARDYLAAHDVTLVECGDLATGADRDSR
ncbi:MAG: nucleotidyltransferase family protein [Nocardioides sp.]